MKETQDKDMLPGEEVSVTETNEGETAVGDGEPTEVSEDLAHFADSVANEYLGIPFLFSGVPDFDLERAEDEEETVYKRRNERFKADLNSGKASDKKLEVMPVNGRPIGKARYTGSCGVSFPNMDVKDGTPMAPIAEFVVYDGQVVKTGPKCKMEIEFEDGSKMRVGAGTVVQLRRNHKEVIEEHRTAPERVRDYLQKLWERMHERKQQVPPPVGVIGMKPEDCKISISVVNGKAAKPLENRSGMRPDSAIPMHRQSVFYEGVLAPAMRAYGTLGLKKGETVMMKIYVSQYVQVVDGAQGFRMEVGDENGGLIHSVQKYTDRCIADLADIVEWPFTAPADGNYTFCFKTLDLTPWMPLRFRIAVQ